MFANFIRFRWFDEGFCLVLFFLRKFTKLIKKRFARVPQVFVIFITFNNW
jgi:hypothetical protein